MKLIFNYITILLVISGSNELQAQCTGGSDEGALTPSPSSSVNTISIKGGRYYTFTASIGEIFLFSTHEDDGGSTAFDTRITILDNAGNALAEDDDFCDRSSRLIWTAPSTATYRVLMMRYNCVGTGTPSVMAYQILSSYTPINHSCGVAACENDEYTLLSNMPADFFDYVSSGGEPDANGMVGSNQSGWQGAEFQRGGVRRMLGAVINNDTDLMDDAWLTIRATFDQQQGDGGFGDNSSDVAFWLHECSHSMLILKESPLYTTYIDSFTKYLPVIQDALEYMTSSTELDLLFNIYDKQAANRLFIDANAIALTGELIGDTTTYLPISRDFIAQGLEIMKEDSFFCEKGGYDTSYQGTSIFELNYYATRYTYTNLDCILRKGTIWEANRVDNTGFIDTVGNTRTGSCQEVYNGVCKDVNYREVARGLYYYGYRFCDFANGINPAIRVYRYDQNNQSYNPTVSCSANCLALPVDLVGFEGICQNDRIVLTWTTQSEHSNIGFFIEKLEENHWYEIGFVEGKVTTTELTNYHFYDENINDESSYYRLRQVDFDGHFEYSQVVSVGCKTSDLGLEIYPNPTKGALMLKYKDGKYYEVYDIQGCLIASETLSNTVSQTLDLRHVRSGMYFIKVYSDHASEVVKFVIE